MLEQNKTFKEYLSNLKKEELNKIIECYNKLCIIFDYPKIEESKGKKEELINSLVNIKDNYFKGIIKLLDQKDFGLLTKIVKKPSEEQLINNKDLINYLKEQHIFYTLDNLSVVTDIDLKKIISSKEVIKYVKKNNDLYKMMDGIIIAYGVIDIKYFNIIISSIDNFNLIIPKLEFYYKKDYKVLIDRIITNKLNNKKRINRYFKDKNYKSFTIKDYIKMGNNTYHHGIKSYKAFIKMLKNHYVFKNSDIAFIDKNIVIPYLYNSLNEEEKANKNLEDTILSLFEFKGDKLRLKMIEEITEIRSEFPLWEYRGYTKRRVKMKNKGYTVVELVIVLAVFSLFYFIGVGVIAKDINVNYEDTMYEQKIAAIEEQASIYAKSKDELFKDSDTIYLTVKELADAAAIISNKDGEVTDPRDGKSNLNEVKVKITNIDSKVTAKVLS